MIIALLGRQPNLGMTELERRYGAEATRWFGDRAALIDTPDFDVQTVGGTVKAGRVVLRLKTRDWQSVNTKIIQHYTSQWRTRDFKTTLGISVYGLRVTPGAIQKTGLALKQKLKSSPGSLRLIPNSDTALSTATSHHNKLGLSDNKVELLIVSSGHEVIVAESCGAQNITALAARDQARPKTDAFVGMLPPKLALMMLNMTGITRGGNSPTSELTILDPFCGTGVVLQEAALAGYSVYGSDLSEKMVDYSTQNLAWLKTKYQLDTATQIEQGDATAHQWQSPIAAVVSETYLGQPFSAPPAPEKLTQVQSLCDKIVASFLTNLHAQLADDTPLCLAVPAWRDNSGHTTHLPVTKRLGELGYEVISLKHATEPLLYYRESQVVARQLLLLKRR